MTVLCQGIGDSSGVCGGDTSAWCRGGSSRCPPAGPVAVVGLEALVLPPARRPTGVDGPGLRWHAPLVTTLHTRASAPRRHPGSWPDVMVFRAGAWTAHAEPVHLVPPPSISFVHGTRWTCAERDRRARDEIKTWATRSTPVLVGSSGRRDQTRPSWRVLVAPRRARGAGVHAADINRGRRRRPGPEARDHAVLLPAGRAPRLVMSAPWTRLGPEPHLLAATGTPEASRLRSDGQGPDRTHTQPEPVTTYMSNHTPNPPSVTDALTQNCHQCPET